MARLVARDYTTEEMAEIAHELIDKESELWKKESAFWSGAEKDACRIRKKFYQQVLVVLNARKNRENNQSQLFGS